MTYAWDAIVKGLAKTLSSSAGTTIRPDELAPPPDRTLGDLALGCFRLAKEQGKNPAEIAKHIVESWKGSKDVERVSAAGPYVNIMLRSESVIPKILSDIETSKSFGTSEDGKGKQLMLEYAQPNTHKEIHVGHLRLLTLGASLIRILDANGWKVIPASYHGDVGAHVAKCLWLLIRKGGLKAVPKNQHTGKYLGALYAEANALVEGQPELKTEVSDLQRRLEAHDPELEAIWKETREWSLKEMKEVFQELDAPVDRQYLESEVVDEGQKIVDALLKKGIAKESQGAVIVDMEDVKLGAFLVRKSDGTSLYATKDLALAHLKKREYPKLARSLLLVDSRQSHYFKQLFETLKRMGFKTPMEFTGFEFVTLKSGAMSSREGSVVTWQSFRDEVMEFALTETRERHPDWDKKRVEKTAHRLMLGGVKFGMLKQDSEKIIVFDQEKALSFDGDTGPYVQYAVTRLSSILKKAAWKGTTGAGSEGLAVLSHPAEKQLAFVLAALPSVVERAGRELRPSLLTEWTLHAAASANAFYRDVPVLDAEPALKTARLRLVGATITTLTTALTLLGIPVPEEM